MIFSAFSFGLMHVGATFMFETERKALYNAFGEEVKLHWEERIGCYKGYCFKVERVDYQEMNYPTLAEEVAEANRMERLKYGISKRQDNGIDHWTHTQRTKVLPILYCQNWACLVILLVINL